MRAVIFYQTTFGSNRRIAKHAAEALTAAGHEVRVSDVKEGRVNDADWADVCIFSSPTHIGNAPRRMRAFLAKVVDSGCEGGYVLICTAVPSKNPDEKNAIHSMREVLSHSRMENLGELVLVVDPGLHPRFEQRLEAFLSLALNISPPS